MEPETSRDILPPRPAAPPANLSGKLFMNAEGLRAGWRLLLYLALVGGFFLLLEMLSRPFVDFSPGKFSIGMIARTEIVGFASAFGAAALMSILERRPLEVYGLPLRAAFGRLFWQGWLLGLLGICVVIGLISAFGGYSFGNLALHGPELFDWAVLWALCMLFVALFEEFLFRGYSLFTLSSGIGFWPAATLLSLIFAAVHYENQGEAITGLAGVFVVSMLWCFTIRRTGTLWLAVGMHAAFDFGETFLFSVPDSGALFPGHLSNATVHGPVWLTGGTVGPEASLFDFLILLILFYVIHRLYPANQAPSKSADVRVPSASDTTNGLTT
jgi:membrane protease YdiL (CAAX protease family)